MFDCGDGRTYKGKAQHLEHVNNSCQAVPIACLLCKGESTRVEWDKHDCIPYLIEAMDVRDEFSMKIALREFK